MTPYLEQRWYKKFSLYWKLIRYTPEQISRRRVHRKYMASLNAAVPGLEFSFFGGGAPCQRYGVYNGKYVYYRLRSNVASLETWRDRADFDTPGTEPLESVVRYDVVPGEPFAGWQLDLPAQVKLLRGLVEDLRPYHPVRNPTGQQEYGLAVAELLAKGSPRDK